MKKQIESKKNLAKIFGAIAFLGVFILNVLLFVDPDNNTISFSALKAYAQTGGGNNEEESGWTKSSVIIEATNVPCIIANPNYPFDKKGGLYNTTTTETHCASGGSASSCTETITMDESPCIAN